MRRREATICIWPGALSVGNGANLEVLDTVATESAPGQMQGGTPPRRIAYFLFHSQHIFLIKKMQALLHTPC